MSVKYYCGEGDKVTNHLLIKSELEVEFGGREAR